MGLVVGCLVTAGREVLRGKPMRPVGAVRCSSSVLLCGAVRHNAVRYGGTVVVWCAHRTRKVGGTQGVPVVDRSTQLSPAVLLTLLRSYPYQRRIILLGCSAVVCFSFVFLVQAKELLYQIQYEVVSWLHGPHLKLGPTNTKQHYETTKDKHTAIIRVHICFSLRTYY